MGIFPCKDSVLLSYVDVTHYQGEDLQLSEMIILNTFLFPDAYLGKKRLDLSAANKVG